MAKLFKEPDSGADHQAEAVRWYLADNDWDGDSLIAPSIDRWHNCREQGYVVSLRSHDYARQLNIAFFEHRNSDEICAVMWEQSTGNPPTIDNAKFGQIYKDKYDVSHRTLLGEAHQMAEWIYDRLTDFWNATAKKAVQP